MLKEVVPVIRDANPNAVILFGGILMDNYQDEGGIFVRSFLDDVLKEDVGDYFDVMNHHTYVGEFNRHYPDLGIIEKTGEIRAKLEYWSKELGDDDLATKPIVVTETGYHSNGPVGEPESSDGNPSSLCAADIRFDDGSERGVFNLVAALRSQLGLQI